MRLHSAQQDLRDTSLKAISGALNRLQYLADLRDTDTAYRHWGLARTHGEEAASRALADEHRDLVTTLLATPFRKLLQDVERSSEAAGISTAAYLEKLCSRKITSLLPPQPDAGMERHLSSVLHALSELIKIQAASTPQV